MIDRRCTASGSADHPPGLHWLERDGELKAVYVDRGGREVDVAWAPQPGSQELFLTSPVMETLYEGTRGPGKTDALLMDFAQHCGPDKRTEYQKKAGVPQTSGFGAEWRGILFRQTYPQLSDVIVKTRKWFSLMFPDARFNESRTEWEWPTGEKLLLRHGLREADYWSYHGHSYPWLAFEELTTWPDPAFYRKMMSCCRSTMVGVPKKIRATTNPYGPGHNWVKLRFRLPIPQSRLVGDMIETRGEPDRIAIHGHLDENKILLHADPDYKDRIRAAAKNKYELKAWLDGSWDIVAGGMFDDLWDPKVHVLKPFDIPKSWRVDRSFDWGSSKPFSVGWWAESDGSDVQLANGKWASTVRGDLFRIQEWYGCSVDNAGVIEPNVGLKMLARDVAKGIVERERRWGWDVQPGPADSSIWTEEHGTSIAKEMQKQVRLDDGTVAPGVWWTRADKRPGSRKLGWEAIRQMMADATVRGPRESAGLYVFDVCQGWLRTVPVLPRALDKDPDDVDTDAEDHTADETRYRVRGGVKGGKVGRVVGMPS